MKNIYSIYTPAGSHISHVIKDYHPICNVVSAKELVVDKTDWMNFFHLNKHLKKNQNIKICLKCSVYLSKISSRTNGKTINFR